jgi:hypothetical protein
MATTTHGPSAAASLADYQRRYFQENREKILARRRQKRAEDRAAGSPSKAYPAKQTAESIEKKRQKCREYYAAHREQAKARAAAWRRKNPHRVRETTRSYRESHAQAQKERFNSDAAMRRRRYEYVCMWQKKRAASDPNFRQYRKIVNQMSRAMGKHLSGRRVSAASRIVQLLGCDWLHFVAHIKAQFQDGMTWENHGLRGWHFDHVVPLSSFDLSSEEQLRKACHYTNVQPLWAADNIRKGGKVR